MQWCVHLTQESCSDLTSLESFFPLFLLKDLCVPPNNVTWQKHFIPDGKFIHAEKGYFSLACWGRSCISQIPE